MYHDNDTINATILSATWRVRRKQGYGTGFLLSYRGTTYPLTCAHVVQGLDEVVIEQTDRRDVSCEVVAIDYSRDLALLKPSRPLHGSALTLADEARPGRTVTTVGYARHYPHFARGLFSGRSDLLMNGGVLRGFAFDLNAQPGKSGSPVCNARGEVLGMVCAIEQANVLGVPVQGASNGVSFAIPLDEIRTFLDGARTTLGTTREIYRKHAPKTAVMTASNFAALQRAATAVGHGPCGVFSGSWDGDVWTNWNSADFKMSLDVPDAWRSVMHKMPIPSSSFILRGHELLEYRTKYRGYIVAFHIRVV